MARTGWRKCLAELAARLAYHSLYPGETWRMRLMASTSVTICFIERRWPVTTERTLTCHKRPLLTPSSDPTHLPHLFYEHSLASLI